MRSGPERFASFEAGWRDAVEPARTDWTRRVRIPAYDNGRRAAYGLMRRELDELYAIEDELENAHA